MKNELEYEAGDRCLHPRRMRKRSHTEELPERIVKNMIGEEEIE